MMRPPRNHRSSSAPSRREFLQQSALTAAALGVGPLAGIAAASPVPSTHAPGAHDDPAAVRAFEARLQRAHPVPLERVRVTGGPLERAQKVTRDYLLSSYKPD